MGNEVIHIYGASGSGTSTLGRCVSDKLGYHFMDTDDYFWEPTNPPYICKRKISERLALMRADIEKWGKVVISGSLAGWGDELIPLFTFVIRLKTDTSVRIDRLKKRERARFGSRLDIGGDMYEHHQEFIEWAAGYDDAGLCTRSKAKHDAWQKLLQCRQIELDGSESLEHNLDIIKEYL